nr:putative reverse transcriptase domain-containing protein [Tanacetum cinerariifolium]
MHPPSPNYVHGREHPPSFDYVPGPEYPPSPVYVPYVPDPEYPEYLVPYRDEAPIKDQPLPDDASPTALSLGHVADSNPEEDLKENLEEDHADYPTDKRDGNNDSSNVDDGDDDKDEEAFEDADDDEEEEEHRAPADSFAVPVVDPILLARDTNAIETDESAPTPPSPRSPQIIPSPPLVVSSPPLPLPSPSTTRPTYAKAPLGYKAAEIRIRAASPPLLLLSTSHRTDIPKAEILPQKRACFTTLAFRFEVRESLAVAAARQPKSTLKYDLRQDRVREMGYGITDTWDEIVEAMQEIAPTTLKGDDRAFLRARVNTLFRDRPYHRHTSMLLNREAMYARRTWAGSEDKSAAIEAHVRTLEAQTLEARYPEPQDEPTENVMQTEVGMAMTTMIQGVRKEANCNTLISRWVWDTGTWGGRGEGVGKVLRAQRANQRVLTCFKCGAQGHFKSICPKLKNKNQRNQAGNGNVVAMAYAVENARKILDANVVTCTFLLNNCYASIFFDTGADRSFVSTAFSSLIDIVPSILDHDYDVELADKKIIRVNTII